MARVVVCKGGCKCKMSGTSFSVERSLADVNRRRLLSTQRALFLRRQCRLGEPSLGAARCHSRGRFRISGGVGRPSSRRAFLTCRSPVAQRRRPGSPVAQRRCFVLVRRSDDGDNSKNDEGTYYPSPKKFNFHLNATWSFVAKKIPIRRPPGRLNKIPPESGRRPEF